MAFRSTSPRLYDAEKGSEPGRFTVLRECPIGVVLRESPHVYDALTAYSHVENGAVDPYSLSPWANQAFGVIGAERARMHDAQMRETQRKRDVSASRGVAAKVLRG